jgi:thiol:disulfide interchange protein DsbC
VSQATETGAALKGTVTKRLLVLGTLCAALCVVRSAADADSGANISDRIKATLAERFPTIKIDVVQPAPIPGLYEVIAGEQVVYTDPAGDYLVVGRMMDTRSHKDLSEEHLAALRAIDFHSLPLDKAITVVRGTGKRKLAIFADPDCPYCRELERALGDVPDVTAYVFLFPLDEVHPHASEHARAIWCSENRSAAWKAWLLEQRSMPSHDCSRDPLADIRALAQSLHIRSTPTVFLESGKRVDGALSTAELARLLSPTTQDPTPGGKPVSPQVSPGPNGQAPSG